MNRSTGVRPPGRSDRHPQPLPISARRPRPGPGRRVKATAGGHRSERRAALPGDNLVHGRYQSTHAITIGTSPAEVWPWLVQLGYGRGGWYSYDRLERAVGAGEFAEGGSARRIVATGCSPASSGPTVSR